MVNQLISFEGTNFDTDQEKAGIQTGYSFVVM
jgi:hypothetical protein